LVAELFFQDPETEEFSPLCDHEGRPKVAQTTVVLLDPTCVRYQRIHPNIGLAESANLTRAYIDAIETPAIRLKVMFANRGLRPQVSILFSK